MDGPNATETRPGGVEGQVGPGEERGNPDPEKHADDAPGEGKHDANLGRVIIVVRQALIGWLRLEILRQDQEDTAEPAEKDDDAMNPHEVVVPGDRHHEPAEGDKR